MSRREAMQLNYDELRERYRTYLINAGSPTSANAINTYVNESVYLWRHEGREKFWEAIASDDNIVNKMIHDCSIRNARNGVSEETINLRIRYFNYIKNFILSL